MAGTWPWAFLAVCTFWASGAALALTAPAQRLGRAPRSIRRAPAAPRFRMLLVDDDDDGDDDNDEAYGDLDDEGDELFIEDVRNEDAEDIMFRFTADGEPKPWALKPHLRVMLDEVRDGRAVLLDVRSEAQWAKGHLSIATHCPLAALEAEAGGGRAALPLPASTDTVVYVHSAFADEGKEGVKASLLLRSRGYTNARYLKEVYEALSAQLQL